MSVSKDILRDYVTTTLALQGYAFSDAQVAEITAQFARIAAIAQTLMPSNSRLPEAQDPGTAPVFRP